MDGVLAHLTARFVTQAENLATEALAYLLQRHPPAADAMYGIASAFGVDIPGPLSFQTQSRDVDGAGIPDLVGVASGGATPVVCEIKFWAGLTAEQPVGYLDRLPVGVPGLLLFVGPEKRKEYLRAELGRRLGEAGLEYEHGKSSTPGPTLLLGEKRIGVVSWDTLLAAIEARLEQAGDSGGISDLRQLRGLAARMDEEAFLPLQPEELSGSIGRRIIQLYGLILDTVTRMEAKGLVSTKGYHASADSEGIGRYFGVRGVEARLRVDFTRWGRDAATPLWLRVSGKPGSAAAEALAPLRHADPARYFERPTSSYLPIYLPAEADRESVLTAIEDQLTEIHDLLAPAALGS